MPNRLSYIFEVRDLGLIQGKSEIFNSVNWKVKSGEHWLIRGGNGSGKTSLVKCILNKLSATKGEISFAYNKEGIDKEIEYVSSKTFDTLFSSSDYLFYQQRYYSTANADVKTVKQLIGDNWEQLQQLSLYEIFKLDKLLSLKLTNLSNGHLRKLVLLKAIAHCPKVLILDYPYEGLDLNSKQEFNNYLVDIVDALACSLIIIDNGTELPNIQFKELQLGSSLILEDLPPKIPKENTPGNEEVISFRGLTVAYGETQIFNNFHWQINKGERWLLYGKNGSGKSTLLSLIFADHPQAYHNNLHLFGKKRGSGESIWDIKGRISFFSAEMYTYLDDSYKNPQTVERFLLTNFIESIDERKRTRKEIMDTMKRFLKFFNLGNKQRQLLRNLSSGEQQLVLLIKTSLYKKQVILLDEPFQFLDLERKQKLKQFIAKQLTTNNTLIVISHNKEEANGLYSLMKEI